ncbi:hypothetical protein PSPO01_05784 [Paraphaeosphaeria sporulosa]
MIGSCATFHLHEPCKPPLTTSKQRPSSGRRTEANSSNAQRGLSAPAIARRLQHMWTALWSTAAPETRSAVIPAPVEHSLHAGPTTPGVPISPSSASWDYTPGDGWQAYQTVETGAVRNNSGACSEAVQLAVTE